MKVYRATRQGFLSPPNIEEVEAERVTDKSVWVKRTRGGGEVVLDQVRRFTESYHYFDTWDAAWGFLLDKATNKLNAAIVDMENAKKQLDTVREMKPNTKQ